MKISATCALMLSTLTTLGVSAQTPVAPADPAAAAQAVRVPPPTVDPAKELKGTALVEALRKGGYVLYMRHAETGTVTPGCTQSNLTANGEEMARTVGAAIRKLKLPFAAIYASELCRAQDTARLLDLGPVSITPDLNPPGVHPGVDVATLRKKRLSEVPAAGSNTLLVAHMVGAPKFEDWIHMEMAEVAVYRPDSHGDSEPVARIPLARWEELIKAAENNASR